MTLMSLESPKSIGQISGYFMLKSEKLLKKAMKMMQDHRLHEDNVIREMSQELMMSKDKEMSLENMDSKSCRFCSKRKLSSISEVIDKNNGEVSTRHRRVKLTVYTASTSPYCVIFCNFNKRMIPVIHLKLRHYTIVPVADRDMELVWKLRAEDSGYNDANSHILLQALNKNIRDEWMKQILPFCSQTKETKRPKFKLNFSKLPALSEQVEDVGTSDISLKSPVRKMSKTNWTLHNETTLLNRKLKS